MAIGLHYSVTIEMEESSVEVSECMKRRFARLGFSPCGVSPEVARRGATTLQFHGKFELEFVDFDMAIRIMVQDIWSQSTIFIAATGGKYAEGGNENSGIVVRTG
jgi:hypothetical protein